MMRRQFGQRNKARDAKDIHVLMRQAGMLTTSALDYWDQLSTLHYGTRVGICSHFRESTIAETGMAWAGAPFVVPASVTLENSVLSVGLLTGNAFLFQTLRPANTYDKLASVALSSSVVDDMVGLRLDDATDNNYLEVLLRVSQASPTLWTVRTRRRTGGGAVTTQDADDMHTPPGFVLRMDMVGTPWEAWNAYPALHTNWGFRGRMYKPFVALGGPDLAFTPTRAGVIFRPGAAGEAYLIARADWFDIGRP